MAIKTLLNHVNFKVVNGGIFFDKEDFTVSGIFSTTFKTLFQNLGNVDTSDTGKFLFKDPVSGDILFEFELNSSSPNQFQNPKIAEDSRSGSVTVEYVPGSNPSSITGPFILYNYTVARED